MSVLTAFRVKKKTQTWTEPKSGKDEPKPNREFWTAVKPIFRLTVTALLDGDPIYYILFSGGYPLCGDPI